MVKNQYSIDLSELLSSLSLALDISSNRSFQHSRRTAYISYHIAKDMGLEDEVIYDVYNAAFIHDIGMTGQLASFDIDEIHRNIDLKKEHCQIGAQIVRYLPFDNDNIYNYVLYHHEEWNGNGIYGLKGNDIPTGAQIIHVADYFDLNFGSLIDTDINIDDILKWVSNSKGGSFNPEVADVFINLMEKEKFWFDLKFHNFDQVLKTIAPVRRRTIDLLGLKQIAKAFGMLVDKKSKFTYEHSNGIGILTRKVALYMGYDDEVVDQLEIAAYLHDLGKLVVPNEILEKPSELTSKEFQIIKLHPYYTKMILNQVKGLEVIAEWAGNHHEKLNGKGYPEKLSYDSLTIEDQIIAVADVYQALTEDRPYRKGMDNVEAINVLNFMANSGYFYEDVVKIVKNII